MNRIDLPHLTWVLEVLVAGRVLTRVQVDRATRGRSPGRPGADARPARLGGQATMLWGSRMYFLAAPLSKSW
jgi:hypothetical protein